MNTIQATVICYNIKAQLIAVNSTDGKVAAIDGKRKALNESYIITLSTSTSVGKHQEYEEYCRAQFRTCKPARALLTRIVAESSRMNSGLVSARMKIAFAKAEARHPM